MFFGAFITAKSLTELFNETFNSCRLINIKIPLQHDVTQDVQNISTVDNIETP